MNKVKSIQISKVEEEKKLGFSILNLKLKGEDINHIITNSIKRIVQSDIPIYAFNDFDITKNTSVFNNNYIKNHIQNIPIWGIDNNLEEFKIENQESQERLSETIGITNDDVDLKAESADDVIPKVERITEIEVEVISGGNEA